MSKIYEALKKAERERDCARVKGTPPSHEVEVTPGEAGTDQEYERLRANLLAAAGLSGMRTILVTAPQHFEGTTTVALGLATALAQERAARVLVVEANLRTPALDQSMPVPETGGLTAVLRGDCSEEAMITRVEERNLSVLVAGKRLNGPPHIREFAVMAEIIARVRPQFDFIVVDSPPVNEYADASFLSGKVDGVILVVEADQTPVSEAEAAKRQLERVGARILGVVLNRKRSYVPAFLESLL